MKKDSIWYSSVLIFVFVASLALVYWFIKSPYFPVVDAWVKTNMVLYVFALFIYKFIGVLFPPIPAGTLTLASIPFLGWFGAYMVDMAGSIFGGMFAYLLKRKPEGTIAILKAITRNVRMWPRTKKKREKI